MKSIPSSQGSTAEDDTHFVKCLMAKGRLGALNFRLVQCYVYMLFTNLFKKAIWGYFGYVTFHRSDRGIWEHINNGQR